MTWEREIRFQPPAPEVIESLKTGSVDFTQSLNELGAPLWVWEYPDSSGHRGAALAYGWFERQDKGIRASLPVLDSVSASLDFDRIDSQMRGLVLFFDQDWNLEFLRTGLLRDLTEELARTRPAYIETEEHPCD